jgi:hypothetical protein
METLSRVMRTLTPTARKVLSDLDTADVGKIAAM